MEYAAVAIDVVSGDADHVLDYRVPPGLAARIAIGHRVRVPFGARSVTGWVVAFPGRASVPEERLKDIGELLDPVPLLDRGLLDLAAWLAERYACSFARAVRALVPGDLRAGRVQARHEQRLYAQGEAPATLARRAAWEVLRQTPGLTRTELARRAGCGAGVVTALLRTGAARADAVEVRRDPFVSLTQAGPPLPDRPDVLTGAQQAALDAILPAVEAPCHARFLLFGVTGSGKTEVYLRAIERTVARGRQAIALVPEIALTPQTVARFRARFGTGVAVLHSGLSAGERHDEWWRLRRAEVGVVVGARSAVFAPLPHLGLIVVDEEQEPSYKSEDAPRYHARLAALRRAEQAGVPVIFGSATPSLEAYAAASAGDWRRLDLPERPGGRPLPRVEAVDLRAELAGGNRELLSGRLREALHACLAGGRQALLFLNRRGFATCVVCRECGFGMRCQHCSVALAYHHSDRLLHCHYCAARARPPDACPRCGSHLLRQMGAGTQRIEEAVRARFPSARVLRMDGDTTVGKGAHTRLYEAFRRGDADVLVGTQMVAKGWDLPGVHLVGVVNADLALHLPDFRAAERTFQLVCQVAGRAGRGDEPGEVVVQSYDPEHYALGFAARHDYEGFAAEELAARQPLGYPPWGHLVRVVASSPSAGVAVAAARRLAAALSSDLPPGSELLGPGAAPLERLHDQYRWHLALKGPDGAALRDAVRTALGTMRGGRARLAVDVDPVNLL